MNSQELIRDLENIRSDIRTKQGRHFDGSRRINTLYDADDFDLHLCFLILLNYFKIVNDDIPNDKSDMSILLHECSEKGGPAISVIWESHQKWIEEEKFSLYKDIVFSYNLSKFKSTNNNLILQKWVNKNLLFHRAGPGIYNPAIHREFILNIISGTEEELGIEKNKKRILVIGNQMQLYKEIFLNNLQFSTCTLCPDNKYFYCCTLINTIFFFDSRIHVLERVAGSKEAFPFEEARFDTIYSFAEKLYEDGRVVDVKDIVRLLDKNGTAFVFNEKEDSLIDTDIFMNYDVPMVAKYGERIEKGSRRFYILRKATPKNLVRSCNIWYEGDAIYNNHQELLDIYISSIKNHSISSDYQELAKEDYLYNSGKFRKPDQLSFVYRHIDDILIRHSNNNIPIKKVDNGKIICQSSFPDNPFNISIPRKYYLDSDVLDYKYSQKIQKEDFEIRVNSQISDTFASYRIYDSKYKDVVDDLFFEKDREERFGFECRLMTIPGLLYEQFSGKFLRANASDEHPICYQYCMFCGYDQFNCSTSVCEVTINPEYDEDFIIYQISKSFREKYILVAPTKEEQHAYYIKKKEEYLLKNIDIVNEVRDEFRRRVSVDLHYLKHDAAHYLSSIESTRGLFNKRLKNQGELRLDDEFSTGHTVKDYLEDISKCVKHVTGFLEQMTYLTDILPQKKVEISSLLKYFVGNCLTTKNYIVELEIEDDVEGKYCLLDERIHKAFDNILSNAERHAFTANNPQRNYRLKVHAKCEDDIITVLFANNGTPPDPTLTEEGYFTRGLHVGKTGHSGFGGSIIREAIEAQNGIVHLYLNKDKEYPFIIEIKLPAYYD